MRLLHDSKPRFASAALVFATLVCAVATTLPSRADAARLVETAREITAGTGALTRGLTQADFNDDGRPDLIASLASAPASVLMVANTDIDGRWIVRQSLLDTAEWYTRIPVAWVLPGPDRLIVLNGVGEAVEYAGWPLREQRRFAVAASARAATIADVDLDGSQELLVAHSAGITAHRLSDGVESWSVADAADDVAVGQLDSDPALEIVVAGGAGRVLDGVTRAVEWTYSDGFGHFLGIGRFGTDGTPWFVGARDWSSLIVYRGMPWSPVWDFEVFDIDSIAVCDVEGDGRDEIVVGEGQWGAVLIIDAATRTLRRSFPHNDHGIAALVATDFDRDGDCDIAFAPYSTFSDTLFTVFDGRDGSLRHRQSTLRQGISAIAVADLDGDGQPERLIAGNTEPTELHVDTRDGRTRLWSMDQTAPGVEDAFMIQTERVLAAQLDADPGLEIVLVGGIGEDVRILVIDSATRTLQRRIGDFFSSPLPDRRIRDAAWVQFDGDTIPELAVMTTPGFGSGAVRIHVISTQTGAVLWDSVPMNVSPSEHPTLIVMQADADPAQEIVVTFSQELRAFDAGTRLLDWTLPLAQPITTAGYDPARGEILIAHGNQIDVLDAITRAPLRTLPDMGYVSAIKPIGGAQPLLATVAFGRVRLIDALSGDEHDRSDWIGPYLPDFVHASSPIAFSPSGAAWSLAVGSQVGAFSFTVRGPDSLFLDGFEP